MPPGWHRVEVHDVRVAIADLGIAATVGDEAGDRSVLLAQCFRHWPPDVRWTQHGSSIKAQPQSKGNGLQRRVGSHRIPKADHLGRSRAEALTDHECFRL